LESWAWGCEGRKRHAGGELQMFDPKHQL
jgi:hypothetical protein